MATPGSQDDPSIPSGSTLRDEFAPASPPDRLGRYRLEGRLGGGGVGEVFLAHDPVMDRRVALKVLATGRLGDAMALARFRREIRNLSRLNHPHIVSAFDADSEGSVQFLIMEYVPGTDLARLVRRDGPLPVGAAAEAIRQVATGLQHAHLAGLVHRDIKPSNLLVGPGGLVKIADLGLARAVGEAPGAHDTQDGSTLGTPDYMAPEQARDPRRADIRADIYGLGCTLYFLLTGRVPFPVPGYVAKLLAHREAEPTPLEALRPGVPPGLADVVRKMMAKDPARRHQAPLEVALALQPFARAWGDEAEVPTGETVTLDLGAGRGPDPGAGLASTEPMTDRDAAGKPSAPAASKPELTPRGPAPRGLAALALGAVLLLLAAIALYWARHHASTTTTPGKVAAAPPAPFRNSIGMELVPIPAGSFRMGSPEAEPGHAPEEGPIHRVTLNRPFYLAKTEVTQAQYTAVMGRNPAHFSPGGGGGNLILGIDPGRLPVDSVTWDDAREFCRQLNDREEERRAGRHYRLPTEAEWEYSCRAGSPAPFEPGDCLTPEGANFSGLMPLLRAARRAPPPAARCRSAPTPPTPSGSTTSTATSANGARTSSGSVPASAAPPAAPTRPAPSSDPVVLAPGGPLRVSRGGGFSFGATECRSAARMFWNHDKRDYFFGLRVACDLK